MLDCALFTITIWEGYDWAGLTSKVDEAGAGDAGRDLLQGPKGDLYAGLCL